MALRGLSHGGGHQPDLVGRPEAHTSQNECFQAKVVDASVEAREGASVCRRYRLFE
jgi:hypothetical protein